MKLAATFILLLLVAFASVSGQDYFFRQYSNEEGLHHSFVYTINQDTEGYLWIGTGEGLYRFDGFDFKYFTTDDGLGDIFVTKIFRDKSGRLWIGHQNGVISILSEDEINVINESAGDQGALTDITQDGRGTVWAAVQHQGLMFIDADQVPKPVSFPVDQDPISHIEPLENDHFLIGTQENLYLLKYQIDKKSMAVLNRVAAYPDSKVVDIFPESAGKYIVISLEDGIFRFDFDSLSVNYHFSAIDDNTDGMLDNLQGGIIDGKGTLWLNSLGNGLIKFKESENQEFEREGMVSTLNGLVSDNVRTIFEDVEGNLWLGMFGEGLLRYADNNIAYYNFPLETGSKRAYAITGDDEELLTLIGDCLLRITHTGDAVLDSYALPAKQSGDKVKTAYMAEDGRLWLGFEQSGLHVSRPSGFRFSSVYISDDELANSVNHITGQEGTIWVSTKKGICRIHPGSDQTRWFTTDHGLPHNNIQQLYIDS
jgi:ligand-binding sensor domain-containing protein